MKIGIVGLLIITFFCVSCRIDGSQVNTEEKVEIRTAEEVVRDELEGLFSQLPEQIDTVDLDKILKPKGTGSQKEIPNMRYGLKTIRSPNGCGRECLSISIELMLIPQLFELTRNTLKWSER